jgi:hypothetical protein
MDWPKAWVFQPPNTHLQNRIEYLANNNRKRIKKSGVRGSNHLFLYDYAYLAGADATLFRT